MSRVLSLATNRLKIDRQATVIPLPNNLEFSARQIEHN